MAITLTTNYKETLTPEIVEIVDDLVENGYELEEVLTVLDYFGEQYQEHLQAIMEMLEDTDASKSELYDYLEEQGIDELEFFDKYKELMDNYDEGAVSAFLSLNYVSDLHQFKESYEGEFDRVDDFVEYILENSGEEIPSWLCIDAEATWNCSLRHNYDEENGYYFRRM